MTRVFVNGISAKSAGGLNILKNFLRTAQENIDSLEYVVATPSLEDYSEFESSRIHIFPLNWRSRASLIPLMSMSYLSKLAENFGCDVVFNLSDIPLKTKLPQVFLFDWPYAIYPDSIAWSRSSYSDYAIRALKLYLFKKFINNIDLVIAQSDLVRGRLEKLYGLSNTLVVPNTHRFEEQSNEINFDFALGDGFKLLFISRYYSHKNFEILIPLAEIIKERHNRIKIIITLDPSDSQGARKFLGIIKERRLSGIIKNVGSVKMDRVFNLFHQVDALFMPTLLETLGLTYLEAMHCSKVILTSDLPFAHAICGNAAIYFDPFNASDIIAKIEETMSKKELIEEKTMLGKTILSSLPNWQNIYLCYAEAFEQVTRNKR